MLAIEPTESRQAREAAEPMDRIEPAEPIDKMEPLEPMLRIDPDEPMDRIDPLEPMLRIDPDEPAERGELSLIPMGPIMSPVWPAGRVTLRLPGRGGPLTLTAGGRR